MKFPSPTHTKHLDRFYPASKAGARGLTAEEVHRKVEDKSYYRSNPVIVLLFWVIC
ncbi:MAG TPA: hypothetical protein VF233_07660 [Nitrososphaeraceae archaeon]